MRAESPVFHGKTNGGKPGCLETCSRSVPGWSTGLVVFSLFLRNRCLHFCLGIKHKTRMKKQENKRFVSMLLCLSSQGFNCQGLLWEPAGWEGMQIASKRRAFFWFKDPCYIFLQEMQFE